MTFDIAEILETATRRERALLAGSTHVPVALRSAPGPRPDAVSPLDRPLLLWPSERRLVPARCWNCGAGRANFETKAPYGLQKVGEIECGPCSRVVVRLKADGTRRVTP